MLKLLFCWPFLFAGSCANSATGYDYSREADAWLNLHTKPTSFSNAKMRCQQEGGILASPTTGPLAQVMIATLAERQLISTLFTGIKAVSSGENVHFGGLPFTSVPLCWADGGAGAEDCRALSGAGALVDVDCARELPYFCQQDNDTITRNLCGNVVGYKLELRFASCYKFHQTLRTWFQAYVMCHEEGGELAVINSAQEAQMLQTMFKENLSDQVIVGFRTIAGEWVTIDEEPLNATGYELWSPGEPNNKDGESCGFLLRTGMLNDDPCDKLAPSICKITL